jgi:hypothetical protein
MCAWYRCTTMAAPHKEHGKLTHTVAQLYTEDDLPFLGGGRHTHNFKGPMETNALHMQVRLRLDLCEQTIKNAYQKQLETTTWVQRSPRTVCTLLTNSNCNSACIANIMHHKHHSSPRLTWVSWRSHLGPIWMTAEPDGRRCAYVPNPKLPWCDLAARLNENCMGRPEYECMPRRVRTIAHPSAPPELFRRWLHVFLLGEMPTHSEPEPNAQGSNTRPTCTPALFSKHPQARQRISHDAYTKEIV